MEAADERLAAFEAALTERAWDACDPETLRAAGAAWTVRARNEHASVAAFDRFALGLLAVAAPPELLTAAHRAALDEIEHARISFALASAYSGQPVGPGPLALDGAIGATDLVRMTLATIEEACVGETLSAVEAEHAAGRATEPAAREALRIIADDEARHAELAWAFVRWALVTDRSLVPAARSCFSTAIDRLRAAPLQRCATPNLEAFGCLDERTRHGLFARAEAELLTPAVRELFGGAARA